MEIFFHVAENPVDVTLVSLWNLTVISLLVAFWKFDTAILPQSFSVVVAILDLHEVKPVVLREPVLLEIKRVEHEFNSRPCWDVDGGHLVNVVRVLFRVPFCVYEGMRTNTLIEMID